MTLRNHHASRRFEHPVAVLLAFLLPLLFAAPGGNAVAEAHLAPLTAIIPASRTSGVQSSAPAYQGPQFVNKILSNGLEVIVVEDHSIPLVTVELAVKNGAYTEPPELNGLSHLYEHMFFKGNRAIANQEDYLRSIGQLGITYNGRTENEYVAYYFNTTSPNFPTAMRFMRDAVRYPLFDEGEFERERQVVIGEMDRDESEPGFYLIQEMTNRLFYKYPSRKNPLGNRATVSSATTAMMRTIQGRYYVPNNSAVIVTGDVQPQDVFHLAQDLFGDWPRTADPFIKFPLVQHPPLPRSEGAVIKQSVENVVVQIGWQGPSVGKDDAATYAADVFSFILRQPDSRFERDLVDSGLVTGVDLSYLTQRNVGPITLTAQTTPEKAKAALVAIYNEIAHFNDKDYFTDEELENAKGLVAAEDLYLREKLSEYAHAISFWWASTGVTYYRDYQANLRRTSRADISRYLNSYVIGQPHVGLALISEDGQAKSQLTPQELMGTSRP